MAFGDFTVTRSTTKWVLNSAGVLSEVAINTPAFEFNTDGTYRGLLVEPAATNLALRSQEFDNASWVKSTGGTGVVPVVTANDAVAPDGTTTADLIVFDRGAGNLVADRSVIAQTPTVVSGTVYTASFYIKAATGADVGKQIAIRGVGVSGYGVVTLTANWVRYTRTETSTSTTGNIELASRGTFNTDNTVSVHVWGAQLETGSVATSYIPTVASTANRTADSVTLTGASSLIGQSAGTMYVEAQVTTFSAGANRRLLDIYTDGSNRITLGMETTQVFAVNVLNGGVVQASIAMGSSPSGTYKLAVAYATNDIAFYANGSSVGTDASATIPATSIVSIGSAGSGGVQFNGHIRSVALFPTRLANATLATLTT